jgi:hypothetical protein
VYLETYKVTMTLHAKSDGIRSKRDAVCGDMQNEILHLTYIGSNSYAVTGYELDDLVLSVRVQLVSRMFSSPCCPHRLWD